MAAAELVAQEGFAAILEAVVGLDRHHAQLIRALILHGLFVDFEVLNPSEFMFYLGSLLYYYPQLGPGPLQYLIRHLSPGCMEVS